MTTIYHSNIDCLQMDYQGNLLDLAPTDGYAHAHLEELVKKILYRIEFDDFINGDDDEYAESTVYVLEPNQKKQRVR